MKYLTFDDVFFRCAKGFAGCDFQMSILDCEIVIYNGLKDREKRLGCYLCMKLSSLNALAKLKKKTRISKKKNTKNMKFNMRFGYEYIH